MIQTDINLVIIEWIDGSGKDTQADLLVERFWFKKFNLPWYDSDTGRLIKKNITEEKKNCSELTFQSIMLANYIELFEREIYPRIQRWEKIVLVRFTPSMEVYSRNVYNIRYMSYMADELLLKPFIKVNKFLLKIENKEDIMNRIKSRWSLSFFEKDGKLGIYNDRYNACDFSWYHRIRWDNSKEWIHTRIKSILWLQNQFHD
jgi:thymidylate kinase